MVCSDKWKLDKIDKIGISIIFIFSTLFCFFDTISFGATIETIAPQSKTGVSYYGSYQQIVENPDGGIIYFYKVHPGIDYTLNYSNVTSSQFYSYVFAESIEPGTDAQFISYFTNGRPIIYNPPSDGYLIVSGTSALPDYQDFFSLTYESKGLQGAVNNLVHTISKDALWGVFEIAIPFLLIIVLASLSFYIIFRLISGISKGKARL